MKIKIKTYSKNNKKQKTPDEMLVYLIEYYKKKVGFTISFNCTEYDFCTLYDNKIYISISQYLNPDNYALFNFLHEVGHLVTNKKGMKRCEEEFYATQWAIEEAKKHNIYISNEIKNDYQVYIYNYRISAFRHKAKNVPSKKELTLVW